MQWHTLPPKEKPIEDAVRPLDELIDVNSREPLYLLLKDSIKKRTPGAELSWLTSLYASFDRNAERLLGQTHLEPWDGMEEDYEATYMEKSTLSLRVTAGRLLSFRDITNEMRRAENEWDTKRRAPTFKFDPPVAKVLAPLDCNNYPLARQLYQDERFNGPPDPSRRWGIYNYKDIVDTFGNTRFAARMECCGEPLGKTSGCWIKMDVRNKMGEVMPYMLGERFNWWKDMSIDDNFIKVDAKRKADLIKDRFVGTAFQDVYKYKQLDTRIVELWENNAVDVVIRGIEQFSVVADQFINEPGIPRPTKLFDTFLTEAERQILISLFKLVFQYNEVQCIKMPILWGDYFDSELFKIYSVFLYYNDNTRGYINFAGGVRIRRLNVARERATLNEAFAEAEKLGLVEVAKLLKLLLKYLDAYESLELVVDEVKTLMKSYADNVRDVRPYVENLEAIEHEFKELLEYHFGAIETDRKLLTDAEVSFNNNAKDSVAVELKNVRELDLENAFKKHQNTIDGSIVFIKPLVMSAIDLQLAYESDYLNETPTAHNDIDAELKNLRAKFDAASRMINNLLHADDSRKKLEALNVSAIEDRWNKIHKDFKVAEQRHLIMKNANYDGAVYDKLKVEADAIAVESKKAVSALDELVIAAEKEDKEFEMKEVESVIARGSLPDDVEKLKIAEKLNVDAADIQFLLEKSRVLKDNQYLKLLTDAYLRVKQNKTGSNQKLLDELPVWKDLIINDLRTLAQKETAPFVKIIGPVASVIGIDTKLADLISVLEALGQVELKQLSAPFSRRLRWLRQQNAERTIAPDKEAAYIDAWNADLFTPFRNNYLSWFKDLLTTVTPAQIFDPNISNEELFKHIIAQLQENETSEQREKRLREAREKEERERRELERILNNRKAELRAAYDWLESNAPSLDEFCKRSFIGLASVQKYVNGRETDFDFLFVHDNVRLKFPLLFRGDNMYGRFDTNTTFVGSGDEHIFTSLYLQGLHDYTNVKNAWKAYLDVLISYGTAEASNALTALEIAMRAYDAPLDQPITWQYVNDPVNILRTHHRQEPRDPNHLVSLSYQNWEGNSCWIDSAFTSLFTIAGTTLSNAIYTAKTVNRKTIQLGFDNNKPPVVLPYNGKCGDREMNQLNEAILSDIDEIQSTTVPNKKMECQSRKFWTETYGCVSRGALKLGAPDDASLVYESLVDLYNLDNILQYDDESFPPKTNVIKPPSVAGPTIYACKVPHRKFFEADTTAYFTANGIFGYNVEQSNAVYTLGAVVVYNGGHYMCYVVDFKKDEWYLFNDIGGVTTNVGYPSETFIFENDFAVTQLVYFSNDEIKMLLKPLAADWARKLNAKLRFYDDETIIGNAASLQDPELLRRVRKLAFTNKANLSAELMPLQTSPEEVLTHNDTQIHGMLHAWWAYGKTMDYDEIKRGLDIYSPPADPNVVIFEDIKDTTSELAKMVADYGQITDPSEKSRQAINIRKTFLQTRAAPSGPNIVPIIVTPTVPEVVPQSVPSIVTTRGTAQEKQDYAAASKDQKQSVEISIRKRVLKDREAPSGPPPSDVLGASVVKSGDVELMKTYKKYSVAQKPEKQSLAIKIRKELLSLRNL